MRQPTPINRRNTNSSQLSIMARRSGKMLHAPDEGKKALLPCRPDPLSSGGGASSSYKLNSAELLDFMTPIEGGCAGVKGDRIYDHPNAFLTTMQTNVVKHYFPEDETGASFRVLKALLSEDEVLANKAESRCESVWGGQRLEFDTRHSIFSQTHNESRVHMMHEGHS